MNDAAPFMSLPPFPGPIPRVGRYHRMELTAAQRRWLSLCYPRAESEAVRRAMGVGYTTFVIFVRMMGLHKDKSYLAHKRREVGARVSACYKSESRRRLMVMQTKTRLHAPIRNYTPSQANHRCSALRRGYWYYEDNSDEGGERYNIYYDDDTVRSAKFEANLLSDGFNVLDGRGR